MTRQIKAKEFYDKYFEHAEEVGMREWKYGVERAYVFKAKGHHWKIWIEEYLECENREPVDHQDEFEAHLVVWKEVTRKEWVEVPDVASAKKSKRNRAA